MDCRVSKERGYLGGGLRRSQVLGTIRGGATRCYVRAGDAGTSDLVSSKTNHAAPPSLSLTPHDCLTPLAWVVLLFGPAHTKSA